MEGAEASGVFWALLALAGVFVGATALLPIAWIRWRFTIIDDEKRADVEDSYRRTIAQVLGAAAIAVTWYWTWSKENEASVQSRAQTDQARVQSANQQYGELLKHLSSNNVDERVAGIYPMVTLVAGRPEYYVPVINLLKSTIRKNAPNASPDGVEKTKVPDDVMAAIYVLGRLPRRGEGLDMQQLYLAGGYFKGSTQYHSANFGRAQLFGADFSGADLADTAFDGAQMSDWESYGSARFSDKVADEWMNKKGWERVQYVVKFDYATLTNASFKNTSVAGASFQHANLTNTIFDQTDLTRADFQYAENLDKAVFANSCYTPPGKPIGLSQSLFQTLRSPC
jgi:Pentapeptide repeats (8 copies)